MNEILEKLNLISFCTSPLYYIPEWKIKWCKIINFDNSYIISVKWFCNVFIPTTTDKKLLYKDMLEILKNRIELSNFPSFFSIFFKNNFKINLKQTEYFFENDIVINLPWKKLNSVRNNINKIKKWKFWEYSIVYLNDKNKDNFLDINNLWYKNETEKWEKFRLSWKKAIEEIILNIDEYKKFDTEILWVCIDWKIVAFWIWCRVSNDYWQTYTIRVWYKNFSDIWYLIRQELWKKYNCKYCISWTWSTKSIKKVKESYKKYFIKKIYSVKY